MSKTKRKIGNRNIRKISKVASGSSYSVTIPIEFIRKLGWREHQKVVFKLRGNKITIEDWPVLLKKTIKRQPRK